MARVLSIASGFMAIPPLSLLLLFAEPAAGQGLNLESLTCTQVGKISPDTIQTTLIGLSVGYAMGETGAPFDLDEANLWFDAFRELCQVAPEARVTEIIDALPDHVRPPKPE